MGIALFFACLLPCVAVVEVVANRLAIRALMILTGLYLCTHTHTHTHYGDQFGGFVILVVHQLEAHS